MRGGMLDTRVTVQSQALSQNTIGESVITWVDFAEVWASVEQLSGREQWALSQVQSPVTTRVLIRPLPGVLTSMRVVFGTRVLTIESIVRSRKRQDHLELMCSEGIVNE
jgi:SPP1 family predicted phage head-tail adaptor